MGGALLRGATSDAVQTHLLHLAKQIVDRDQTCLYVSARDPQTLAVHAAECGFDLAQASRDGGFRLLPLPDALTAKDAETSDDARTQALADMTMLTQRRRPDYLIVEDAAPLASFEHGDWFDVAFAAMHERFTDAGTAFLLAVDGPEDSLAHTRLSAHIVRRRTLPAPPAPAPRGEGAAFRFDREPEAPAVSSPALQDTPLMTDATIPEFRAFKGSPERESSARPEKALSIGRGHYVAAGATFPDVEHAATHLSPLDRALLGGTTVEARSDGYGAPEPVSVDTDLFEAVDVRQALATFEAPSVAPPLVKFEPVEETPRIAFVRAFNSALAEHETAGTPFLAVALRVPDGHPAGRRFHFVIEAVRRSLGPDETLLADEDRRRLVVLLRAEGKGGAQPLFGAIRAHLHASTVEAEHVMKTVSAVLIPNGAPFPNATEFLIHAFD